LSKNACFFNFDLIVPGHGAGQDEEAADLSGLLLQRRVREYFCSGKFSAKFFETFPAMIIILTFPPNFFYLFFLKKHP
jgi:hypothetical protein